MVCGHWSDAMESSIAKKQAKEKNIEIDKAKFEQSDVALFYTFFFTSTISKKKKKR